jgi:UDP-N-acetylmuramoyl-tripeptide--D-alanyl-D-alanine ligase
LVSSQVLATSKLDMFDLPGKNGRALGFLISLGVMNKRTLGAAAAAVLVILGVAYYFGYGGGGGAGASKGEHRAGKPKDKAANTPAAPYDPTKPCEAKVTKEELIRSVELGTGFLITHQRPSGNFDYEYDWKAKSYSKEDSDVRQAGALWALALIQEFEGPPAPPPALRPALEKGLAFFDTRAADAPGGGRYPVYIADGVPPDHGGLGTSALLTLSMIDYVRGLPPSATAEREKWTARIRAYLKFIVDAREKSGLFFGKFRYDGGVPFGAHSSYSDGESLLAMVLAMKYLGMDDLAPVIKKAAEAGHRINVDTALAADKDSDETKGFYQWSSMAFYELATSSMGKEAPYGDWLVSLADWMLDVHKVLEKQKNTGYAFEGIISAYAWAKSTGDAAHAAKFECATHRGLASLMSWQIGHPRATELGPSDDPKAIGGVQNHKTEPALRIDVTQHQMHATMMAIHHLFGSK